jgi:hypothetical protein
MKKLPFLCLIAIIFAANSQYYYKDLVAARYYRLMKTYTANNIKRIMAKASPLKGSPLRVQEVGEVNGTT